MLLMFLLTIAYTLYASVVRIYVFNRGLNTNDNTFNLQPNAAKTATNVFVKSGKVFQRYGSDSWKSYGATDQYYKRSYYYSPNVQLVGNVDGYIINLESAGHGYIIDNSLVPVYADVQSFYPILGNSGVGLPYDFDCELFRGVEYCTGYEDALQVNGPSYDNITLFKLDGRMSSNLIISFDSTSSPYTIAALNAQSTNVGVETTGEREGTGYMSWNKTAGSTEAGIEITTAALNLSKFSSYYLTLWTSSVATGTSSGTYKIRFSTAGYGTDYLEYNLATGSTSNKYNLINMASPDATLGATDLANIVQITIRLTTPGVNDVYTEAGVDALTFFPNFFRIGVPTNTNTLVAANAAGGVLTGSYSYKFSCKSWDGTEGNVGPVSNTVTLTTDVINLTSIDVCAEDYVNIKSRVIYRNKNGTSTYWKVAEIENNVVTTYQDNIPDSSLTILAPTAGDPLNDNSVPTNGKFIESYNNRLFIGPSKTDDNALVISDISDNNTVIEPESFPINNTEVINPNDNDGITGMKTRLNSLVVAKPHSLYSLEGSKPGEYFVSKILHNKGTHWNNGLIMVDGVVIFLAEDSFYALGSDETILDIGYPIKNLLGNQTPLSYTSVPLMSSEYYPTDNQVWFLIPSSQWNGGTADTTFVAVLNLDGGLENPVWTKYSFTHNDGSSCTPDYLKDLRFISNGLMSGQMLINIGGMEILKYPASDTLGDEGSCTFTATWETKPLYECGQETSPATPKKFDWIKLIAQGNQQTDLTLSWGFDDQSNTIDGYDYSQTVNLDYITSTGHVLVYPKIPLNGGSGINKNLSFMISHVSGVGGATTGSGDQFALYGYEYKCQDLGGEF